MLFNLIEKLPIDVVGSTVLHYLNIKDIVMLERACGSKAAHKLFMDLIPHFTAAKLSSYNYKEIAGFEWFAKRNCKIKYTTITLPGNNPALHVKNLQVEHLGLTLKGNVTIESCTHMIESHLTNVIRSIDILEDQNNDVIEQISLLTENIKSLRISHSNNYKDWLNKDILSRWKLKEIFLKGNVINLVTITLIVQTCSELTSIKLESNTVNDDVVMAVAQHCAKLETLVLPFRPEITSNSLLALSKRYRSLVNLHILNIPIFPSADIAKRCSHALSCIRSLNTYYLSGISQDAPIFLPYMTGLTKVFLEDHFIPFIPLLAQYCHMIKVIEVDTVSLSVLDILSLCAAIPLLKELLIYASSSIGITDTTLIELIHTCPHLHTLYLPHETNITDIGVLALSEHCPQLQFLSMHECNQVIEISVLQLLQRCRKLTILEVSSSCLSEETWTQLDKNTQKRVRRCKFL